MYFIYKIGAIYIQGVYGPYESVEDALKSFHNAYEKAKTYISSDNQDYGPKWHFDGFHKYIITRGLPEFTGENSNVENTIKRIEYKPLRDLVIIKGG